VPGCADDRARPGGVHPGGEWRTYGKDLDNTRVQHAETEIGPDEAATLEPVWTVDTAALGAPGDVTGTPVVADGCVFFGTNGGWVLAVNADTGALVWKTAAPRGGRVPQSVAVVDGVVYASVTGPPPTASGEEAVGPYVMALDEVTGTVLWATQGLDDQTGSDLYGSPIPFDATDNGLDDPVLFAGLSGWGAESDFSPTGELRYAYDGSFVLLDALTGATLEHTFVIADDDTDAHAGCGIWSTPAVDLDAGIAYVGTSNPFRPESEHERCNALLKIDVDRTSPTFGQVLDSAKATKEEYVSHYVEDYPCIPAGVPSPTPSQQIGTCPDMDLSVGASPNLMRDVDGRTLVGVGQKSGIYYAYDPETMDREWSTTLGLPTLVGGIVGSTAFDGTNIYGPNTAPGYMWSVDAAQGGVRWVGAHSPIAYANPTTVANGVAYTTDQAFKLNAYETATGRPLLARDMSEGSDAEFQFQSTQGGIAVARNTVYAAVGSTGQATGYLIAFRPGGVPLPTPEVPELPAPPSGLPAQQQIVAGPAAVTTGFATRTVVVPRGTGAAFTNGDSAAHDIVSRVRDADGRPLFRSKITTLGTTSEVSGVQALLDGDYDFFCSLHPAMTGTLKVVGAP
jgi:outer membrane protein assembly factor BamB